MSEEQIEKSIGQMRGMFAFIGGIFSFMLLAMVITALTGGDPGEMFSSGRSRSDPTVMGVVLLVLAAPFWVAFFNMKKERRNNRGYNAARVCSVIFLFTFPVLTLFGISYLRKLSDLEMKKTFGHL